MHPTGNLTTIILTRGTSRSLGRAKGFSRTYTASQELREWHKGQIFCRNTGDSMGLGAWWGLVLTANCWLNSPTLHLPTENPVSAPLSSIVYVTIAAPLEIILKFMVLLQRGMEEGGIWERGCKRGDLHSPSRDKAGTVAETGLRIKMDGHSHHCICILDQRQVPTIGNCLLKLCLKPWW